MNELQFYLSIAVAPVVTMAVVLVGVLVNISRFAEMAGAMDSRFRDMADTMNGRFSEMNGRFTEMDGRFSEMAGRFSEMAGTMDSRFREMTGTIDSRFNDMNAGINSRLNDMRELIRSEVGRVEAKVDRVESVMLTKFAELDTRISRIEGNLNLE